MSSMSPVRLRRTRRAARIAAPTVAAFSAVFAFAAFTDEASNAGNSATAADVTITEDVAATAPLFSLDDWQPGEDGDTVSRCIGITNGGSIPVPLKLRLASTPSGDLGDFVDMTVERGTRPTATDDAGCGSFVAAGEVYRGELDEFPVASASAIADGAGKLAIGAERAYRITWKLQDTEEAEGRSIGGVTFRWETTSAG
jgi:hypothetical protein